MKLVETLSGWFADLQPRERLVITLGGGLLVAAALYLALLPAMEKNAELNAHYSALVSDMAWLREQSQLISRMKNSCPGRTLQAGETDEVISRIVRRNQMKVLGLLEKSPELFSLSVSGISPNRILQLVHQLACQGLVLKDLKISPATGANIGFIGIVEVSNVN